LSRSIHTTHRDHRRRREEEFADEAAHREQLERIADELQQKRLIKELVRKERASLPASARPPLPVQAIPIRESDASERVHYPAGPEDLRAVLERLPPGTCHGLSIQLCLGKQFQEELTPGESPERDPWVGRASAELLPDVFWGLAGGTYWHEAARIDLYAHVYDPALLGAPEQRPMWELYLKLRMLSVLVHEVAHHQDATQRIARGRWRMDDSARNEVYAERTQALWVRQYVVPWLSERYPDEVGALQAWLVQHGGIALPLELLAGTWRLDTGGEPVPRYFMTEADAFENLVRAVRAGEPPLACQIEFARDLHYCDSFEEALAILEGVLAREPGHLDALTLQADVLVHLERYELAGAIIEGVLSQRPQDSDAWMVQSDVLLAQARWEALREASQQAQQVTEPLGWQWAIFLLREARAMLELGAPVQGTLQRLTRATPSARLQADGLFALSLLRGGEPARALATAEEALRRAPAYQRAVLRAVAYEACQRLGRDSEPHEPSAVDLRRLRRAGHGPWVDALVERYGLIEG
jgi:tetratricopeptide (TPR) repeat protein